MTTMKPQFELKQTAAPRQQVRKILVGADFSDNTSNALKWATELAASLHAEIILVHAIDSDLPAIAHAREQLSQRFRDKLDALGAQLKVRGVKASSECRIGKAWQVIPLAAQEHHVDLIVLGAHGRSSMAERFLGSTAARVIKTTSIPVLTIHRGMSSKVGQNPIRTILVTTDFSEEASLATSMAARLLKASGKPSRLILLHTVALLVDHGIPDIPMPIPHYWDEAERTAAKQLETMAAGLKSDLLQVEVKTFRGYPAESILHEAQALKADLIAMGTQGRTGINRFFMGSVAERVLHHAPCPVLTVRKPDADEPIRLSAD
ncbi:MAG: universal stress protein [Phycisphaerales bacterium]|nr:universal stress protein [Phycisphaerales bacterium]